MQKPVIAAADAAALVESGATLMIGGFMVAGTPCRLIDALVDNGARDHYRQRHRLSRPGNRQADRQWPGAQGDRLA